LRTRGDKSGRVQAKTFSPNPGGSATSRSVSVTTDWTVSLGGQRSIEGGKESGSMFWTTSCGCLKGSFTLLLCLGSGAGGKNPTFLALKGSAHSGSVLCGMTEKTWEVLLLLISSGEDPWAKRGQTQRVRQKK